MSGSLNRATLVGNVGKDPEARTLQSGGSVTSFSLATSETWTDKNTGERRERTEWHNIVVWHEGFQKVIEKYVRKGSKILVEGQIQTRKWQDQSGQDRYMTEIVLRFDCKLILLGGRDDAQRGTGDDGYRGERSREPARRSESSDQKPAPPMRRAPIGDDEIPF